MLADPLILLKSWPFTPNQWNSWNSQADIMTAEVESEQVLSDSEDITENESDTEGGGVPVWPDVQLEKAETMTGQTQTALLLLLLKMFQLNLSSTRSCWKTPSI